MRNVGRDRGWEPLLFDHDVERAFLGRVLLHDDAEHIEGIRPFHFHDRRHQVVFKAILRLHRAGHPVGLLAVKNLLMEAGSLAEAGGHPYLAVLIQDPTTNSTWCAGKLRQFAIRRRLDRIAREISEGRCFGVDLEDSARLVTLTRRIEFLTAELEGAPITGNAGLRRLDLQETMTAAPTERPWVIERWLAPRDVVCLAGEPKVGKSWLALERPRVILSRATSGSHRARHWRNFACIIERSGNR